MGEIKADKIPYFLEDIANVLKNEKIKVKLQIDRELSFTIHYLFL